jgi:hypothetical protein
MAEKPIVMSDLSVLHILNTKPVVWPAEPVDPAKPFKWMTRRVVKPQPDCDGIWNHTEFPMSVDSELSGWWGETNDTGEHHHYSLPEKGDIFWVREKWRQIWPELWEWPKADYYANSILGIDKDKAHWKSSRFMPRWAARLFLEVKDVRVERLQDISEKDARAEGIKGKYMGYSRDLLSDGIIHEYDNVEQFMDLWDALNARRGYPWESNPWVYVYEFMRLT